MKFIEIVGNASTTAVMNGRKLGHNVNAVAYENGNNITLRLESNGSRVTTAADVIMTKDEYEDFCEKKSRPLFFRGIELFGAEVMIGGKSESEDEFN
ncbi:hypothetical protein WCT79_19105 [Pectobacterium carotovorum]|uniref:hypothetical protein n=1 Tax=Pectobacterium carotovorum TaxID=554 RepID=UPI003016F1BE